MFPPIYFYGSLKNTVADQIYCYVQTPKQTLSYLLACNPTARISSEAAPDIRKSVLANAPEQLFQSQALVAKRCVGIFMPEDEPLPQELFQNNYFGKFPIAGKP